MKPLPHRPIAFQAWQEISTAWASASALCNGTWDGTLQPILMEMLRNHHSVCEDTFHDYLPALESLLRSSLSEQLAFARSIQDGRFRIAEPWKGMLKALGRTGECQAIQATNAKRTQEAALAMCRVRSDDGAGVVLC
ncbi:MAG: hypothetical protein WKF37_11840 [Bryobacteraceae bacterium]